MENKKRCREQQQSLCRFDRFYSVANEWYFSVRETEDQGPYPTRLFAENSLKTYLLDYEHFNSNKNKLNINNLKLI